MGGPGLLQQLSPGRGEGQALGAAIVGVGGAGHQPVALQLVNKTGDRALGPQQHGAQRRQA